MAGPQHVYGLHDQNSKLNSKLVLEHPNSQSYNLTGVTCNSISSLVDAQEIPGDSNAKKLRISKPNSSIKIEKFSPNSKVNYPNSKGLTIIKTTVYMHNSNSQSQSVPQSTKRKDNILLKLNSPDNRKCQKNGQAALIGPLLTEELKKENALEQKKIPLKSDIDLCDSQGTSRINEAQSIPSQI